MPKMNCAGTNGEANRKANPADTIYADQKTGLLPEWVMEMDAPAVFSRKAPPLGIAVEALPTKAKAPKVDWNREQAQNWITPNPEEWKNTGWGRGTPTVYRAYLTDADMPRVRASVDMGNEYDWSTFKKTGVYPPIVVIRHANGVATKLEDGHHRMTYWREKGFTHYPAWIVDFTKAGGPETVGTSAQVPAHSVSELRSDPLFSPRTWVSQIEKVLELKMPKSASAAQIKGILSTQNGIKPDELEAMGIGEYLASKEKFDKHNVLEWVKEHQIQAEKVEFSDQYQAKYQHALDQLETAYEADLLKLNVEVTDARVAVRNLGGIPGVASTREDVTAANDRLNRAIEARELLTSECDADREHLAQ